MFLLKFIVQNILFFQISYFLLPSDHLSCKNSFFNKKKNAVTDEHNMPRNCVYFLILNQERKHFGTLFFNLNTKVI